MGIGDSKCQKELKLEKKAIQLFLKNEMKELYEDYTDLTQDYEQFKNKYPTIDALQKYKTDKETTGTQKLKKTRRNKFK